MMAQWKRICLSMWEKKFQFLGWEHSPEKEMAIHSSILAWEIPCTEELGGLESMGLQKIQTQYSN